jgi:hypothetical protein
MQMEATLLRHKQKRNLVAIERKDIGEIRIQGFILGISQKLVLIQYVYDFRLDGLMILRVPDISDLRFSKTEKFQLKLLKDEKIYDRINFNSNFDLTDWKTAILGLRKDYEYFILENELGDDPTFLIGKIAKMTPRNIHLNYFSGAGNWDREPSIIKYNDITACQVDSNYINVYKRFFERHSKKGF